MNVQDLSFLELVGPFEYAFSANTFLSDNEVDLMFIDIQMPGITGLEFIRSLKNRSLVILTTAYPEYALEGFELDVVDYLLKSIRLNRFIKAVNKAKEISDLYQQKNKNEIGSISDNFIYIKSERKFIRVYFKDILYIKGLKDYVMLFTNNARIMTAMNIKTINTQLPSSIFVRTGKSYLININYIDSVETDLIHLAGEEIPLGKTCRDHFINNYIKKNLIDRK